MPVRSIIKDAKTIKLKRSKKAIIRNIVFSVFMIVFFYITFQASLVQMNRSLYQERADSSTLYMQRTVQNINTALEAEWNNLHFIRAMFISGQVDSLTVAEDILTSIHNAHEDMFSGLFLIDSNRYCHLSNGSTYFWKDTSYIATGNNECLISDRSFHDETNGKTHLYFITPINELLEIDGKQFTHIGLSLQMSALDEYFNSGELGQQSITFVLRESGKQIYNQEKFSEFDNEKDIIADLAKAKFHYGSSYEDLMTEITSKSDGCISFTYKDTLYYATYNKIAVNDWIAFSIIPSEYVGSSADQLFITIMVSLFILALGLIAVIVFVVVTNAKRLNTQLAIAAEAERKANNAKTQFLSSMSHDIRTPMNAIVGMITLAKKHRDDTVYVDSCLDKAALASNHLLTLINDVLDISKVESGMMNLNPTVFSLVETVDNLMNIIRPQVNEKLQTFDIRVHNIKNEYVFADQLRINQIFINIMSNAVKYTSEGGRIEVDFMAESIPGNDSLMLLVYKVKDNGVGMTDEFQRNMYTSFARENNSPSRTVQGSGLGLAIVKQMVDIMEGTIECRSAVGVGTEFTVSIPLQLADRIVDDLILPPMDILLVDDDEVFLESASDTLRDMGVTPSCVRSGSEAVKAVEKRHAIQHDYPVVIIDYMMPEMDGIETTKLIRQKVGDDVPIIVISAYESEDIEEEALAAGANGFISKPFFRSSVYKNMSEILGLGLNDSSSSGTSEVSLAGMNILVAEDNDLNWEIAKEILSLYDVNTVRAENGKKCLEIIENASDNEYDMILMDIQMPVMNGYEATRAIRNSTRAYIKNIPVIAMTADAFAEDIKRANDIGMNAHIAKPIDVAKLIEILQNIKRV